MDFLFFFLKREHKLGMAEKEEGRGSEVGSIPQQQAWCRAEVGCSIVWGTQVRQKMDFLERETGNSKEDSGNSPFLFLFIVFSQGIGWGLSTRRGCISLLDLLNQMLSSRNTFKDAPRDNVFSSWASLSPVEMTHKINCQTSSHICQFMNVSHRSILFITHSINHTMHPVYFC